MFQFLCFSRRIFSTLVIFFSYAVSNRERLFALGAGAPESSGEVVASSTKEESFSSSYTSFPYSHHSQLAVISSHDLAHSTLAQNEHVLHLTFSMNKHGPSN